MANCEYQYNTQKSFSFFHIAQIISLMMGRNKRKYDILFFSFFLFFFFSFFFRNYSLFRKIYMYFILYIVRSLHFQFYAYFFFFHLLHHRCILELLKSMLCDMHGCAHPSIQTSTQRRKVYLNKENKSLVNLVNIQAYLLLLSYIAPIYDLTRIQCET